MKAKKAAELLDITLQHLYKLARGKIKKGEIADEVVQDLRKMREKTPYTYVKTLLFDILNRVKTVESLVRFDVEQTIIYDDNVGASLALQDQLLACGVHNVVQVSDPLEVFNRLQSRRIKGIFCNVSLVSEEEFFRILANRWKSVPLVAITSKNAREIKKITRRDDTYLLKPSISANKIAQLVEKLNLAATGTTEDAVFPGENL